MLLGCAFHIQAHKGYYDGAKYDEFVELRCYLEADDPTGDTD
jgi:hypothetical protein